MEPKVPRKFDGWLITQHGIEVPMRTTFVSLGVALFLAGFFASNLVLPSRPPYGDQLAWYGAWMTDPAVFWWIHHADFVAIGALALAAAAYGVGFWRGIVVSRRVTRQALQELAKELLERERESGMVGVAERLREEAAK